MDVDHPTLFTLLNSSLPVCVHRAENIQRMQRRGLSKRRCIRHFSPASHYHRDQQPGVCSVYNPTASVFTTPLGAENKVPDGTWSRPNRPNLQPTIECRGYRSRRTLLRASFIRQSPSLLSGGM